MDIPPTRQEWPGSPPEQPPVRPPWAAPGQSSYPPGPPPPPASAPLSGSSPEPSRSGGGWRRTTTAVALAVLLVGLLGFVVGRRVDRTTTGSSLSSPAAVQPVTTGTTAAPPLSGNEAEPAAAVAKILGPAVVQIETDRGLGSGFIYDRSGLILTAAHVVDGSDQVRVRLADGSRQTGKVLGTDDFSDVAVVRIKASSKLPVAVLATGVTPEVGQTAIAIGSPFGLNQTVTAGIVSAVARSVETPGGAVPMVQTDAPINPGNSGGALADRRGRVIGINDSIAGQSGGNVGVGFAIPIDIARSVADRIVAGKSTAAGVLGIRGQDATGSQPGAQLTVVSAGSPAARSGLQVDDTVVAIDGNKVESMIDLAARIGSREPGQQVTITFVRNGQQRQATVTLTKSAG